MSTDRRCADAPIPRWRSPLPLAGYDRSPVLHSTERAAIAAHLDRGARLGCARWTTDRKAALERLLTPLHDALAHLGVSSRARWIAIDVLLSDMLAREVTYWAWSEGEWAETIGATQRAFMQRYAPRCVGKGRTDILAIAYHLGGLTDPLLFPAGGLHHETMARRVFGPAAIDAATQRVMAVIETWGYRPSRVKGLRFALCLAFLAGRTDTVEGLTPDLLAHVRARTTVPQVAAAVGLLSRALAALGNIDHPLPTGSQPFAPWAQRDTTGIAPEWVAWAERWHRGATRLAPPTRDRMVNILLKVGRWLACTHPDVVSPAQWTYALAADWVSTLDGMRVGDFCGTRAPQRYAYARGKPLSPSSKAADLTALRAFFRDLHEEPYNVPRRFDPDRAFRTPAAIRRVLGPNPRDIDPLTWARLVHAAVNLTEADLPSRFGYPLYPLALVRAVAVVWCYAALRSNEICRLRVGCVRWQREDVRVPETGEVLPKDAVCFLTVPVNKTSAAFPKAVNPIVGKAIDDWEQVRPPDQPRTLDPKTSEMVDYLFAVRGHAIADAYINQSLIPLLCEKAGLPSADERGRITSHRARATIATLLYNAPEGLSIWELMQWLGHRNPASTQHYARMKPTKLATSYLKADRTSRLVEVLVDMDTASDSAPKLYYVLGDQGLCSNAEWASCIYRMACVKCPFFVPQDQVRLIESRATIKRFLEVVKLNPAEEEAVRDDLEKMDQTIARVTDLPRPTMLRQRGGGETAPGVPLTRVTEE